MGGYFVNEKNAKNLIGMWICQIIVKINAINNLIPSSLYQKIWIKGNIW